MRLQMKTLSVWLLMCFLYVGVPVLWVYDVIFNQGELIIAKIDLLDQVDNFFEFLLIVPLCLLILLFFMSPIFYLMELGCDGFDVYRELSFSYIKTRIYLTNRELFYNKLFTILDELFENGTFINKVKPYEITCSTYNTHKKSIHIHFHDDVLHTTLYFELTDDGVFICKDTWAKTIREGLVLKDHDKVMYNRYYRELVKHCVTLKNKQKEKERVIHQKELAKQEAEIEKEKLREEERLEKILSTVMLMKKRNISYSELSVETDMYTIRLEKRNIEVSNNQTGVLLKCKIVAGEPVVYVQNQKEESTAYQKVVRFYTTFLSKTERTV